MNKFKGITDPFVLKNGVGIPCVGLGTYLMENDAESVQVIESAIVDCGYRHIDTAAFYGNEVSVGKAVKACGVPREKIFVTTKVWNTDRGYNQALQAFDQSLERLGLDYVDLLLIHWPATQKHYMRWEQVNIDTWRAFSEIYAAGRAKAIGVANFKPSHLSALMDEEIQPMVNQIEFHPGFYPKETIEFCQQNGIQVEAWSPLGRGKVLESPVLLKIAAAHKKSTAQIALRWILQHDVLPLPKSTHTERMEENADIFNFTLTPAEMKEIDEMPETGYTGKDPDTIDF
jgi:diketogulonate reductase-like aldo/keto reductase